MLYPILLVCSMSVEHCTIVEDTTAAPYETVAECRARLEEMNAAVPNTLLPGLMTSGVPGPFNGRMGCFDEDGLREHFPGSYDLEPEEPGDDV